MKSIKELLSNDYDERIKKILNRRNKSGNTPLHFAVSNWPQKIVKDMLKLGADLSIENKEKQTPLAMIPKSTIGELLDGHCMESDEFGASDEDECHYDLNDDEKGNAEDERLYKELLDDYDPKFMTNIVQLPITFKYDLLTPAPHEKRLVLSDENYSETNQPAKSEMSVLNAISKSKEHCELVTHPVVKLFIWLKWKMICKFYNRNLRMNVLLTYCLTWYIYHSFGGFEWNNKCKMKSAGVISNSINFTEYCSLYMDEYVNLTKSKKYAELENMSLIERWKYYVEQVHIDEGVCLYVNLFYFLFIIISLSLMLFMVKDTIRDIFPSGTTKNANLSHRFRCISCVLPYGIDTINIFLIIIIIIFSVRILWLVISVIFLIKMFIHIGYLITLSTSYYKKPSNWADFGILLLISVVIYVPNDLMYDPIGLSMHSFVANICNYPDSETEPWQQKKDVRAKMFKDVNFISPSDVSVKRHLSSFIIVLSWTRLLFDIFKHPGTRTENYNKYAMMYGRVASSFFKLLVCYCLFLVSFSVGFYIGFHNDIGDERLNLESLSPYVFFDSQFSAIIKTTAMLVGDVDFNDIPVGIPYARRHGFVSVVLGYLFFVLFIFMINIVLMNLMNGLAVTDIAEIIKESKVLHQISLTEILSDYEETALTYKKGIEFMAKIFPCLKRHLFNHLDISKELLLFSTNSTSGISRKKLSKMEIEFPSSYSDHERFYPDKTGLIGRFFMKYFCPDDNKDSEPILSEAQAILIKAKKSRMEKRIMAKKQLKEEEESVKNEELERRKIVAMLKKSVVNRLLNAVEMKNSIIHI